MKKIGVYLSIMAFVLAFSGTVASQRFFSLQNAYEFVDMPGTENDRCDAKGNVCDVGTIACTIGSGPVLRSNDDETTTPACGAELKILN